jgi:aminoglycoside/choline kinase family phosphotransferase
MTLPQEAAAFLRETEGEDWTAEPLAGDASVRAYYRIRRGDGSTLMLTWYPAEVRTQLGRFLRAWKAVSGHGSIPEVVRWCDTTVLQRDVGDRTLFDLLHEDRETGLRLYRKAIDLLTDFQKSAPESEINPPFTAKFFFDELEMTRDFYVEKLVGVDGTPLVPMFREIAEKAARHPYVLCHRDYHGQNLHVINDDLFVIDYQDLRMGPDTYDLASLLRDRGVARILGDDAELELVDYYGSRLGAGPEIRHRYFESLLQRSIKILGTWAKQIIVRGRMHYMDFVEPSLEAVSRAIEQLPEYRPLLDLFPMHFDREAAYARLGKGVETP